MPCWSIDAAAEDALCHAAEGAAGAWPASASSARCCGTSARSMAANMNLSIVINVLFAGDHRVRRRLQRRARLAVGAQPRAGQPARARLHPRRDLADPARRAGGPDACRAAGRGPCSATCSRRSSSRSIESEVYRFPLYRLPLRRWRSRFSASSPRRRCRRCWCGGGSIGSISSPC